MENFDRLREDALIALVVCAPKKSAPYAFHGILVAFQLADAFEHVPQGDRGTVLQQPVLCDP